MEFYKLITMKKKSNRLLVTNFICMWNVQPAPKISSLIQIQANALAVLFLDANPAMMMELVPLVSLATGMIVDRVPLAMIPAKLAVQQEIPVVLLANCPSL